MSPRLLFSNEVALDLCHRHPTTIGRSAFDGDRAAMEISREHFVVTYTGAGEWTVRTVGRLCVEHHGQNTNVKTLLSSERTPPRLRATQYKNTMVLSNSDTITIVGDKSRRCVTFTDRVPLNEWTNVEASVSSPPTNPTKPTEPKSTEHTSSGDLKRPNSGDPGSPCKKAKCSQR
jgi:hypothetical protein